MEYFYTESDRAKLSKKTHNPRNNLKFIYNKVKNAALV